MSLRKRGKSGSRQKMYINCGTPTLMQALYAQMKRNNSDAFKSTSAKEDFLWDISRGLVNIFIPRETNKTNIRKLLVPATSENIRTKGDMFPIFSNRVSNMDVTTKENTEEVEDSSESSNDSYVLSENVAEKVATQQSAGKDPVIDLSHSSFVHSPQRPKLNSSSISQCTPVMPRNSRKGSIFKDKISWNPVLVFSNSCRSTNNTMREIIPETKDTAVKNMIEDSGQLMPRSSLRDKIPAVVYKKKWQEIFKFPAKLRQDSDSRVLREKTTNHVAKSRRESGHEEVDEESCRQQSRLSSSAYESSWMVGHNTASQPNHYGPALKRQTKRSYSFREMLYHSGGTQPAKKRLRI